MGWVYRDSTPDWRKRLFSPLKRPDRHPCPFQPTIQRVRKVLSLGVKRPAREAVCWPQSSAEVKNHEIQPLSLCLQGMLRDNMAFCNKLLTPPDSYRHKHTFSQSVLHLQIRNLKPLDFSLCDRKVLPARNIALENTGPKSVHTNIDS